MRAAILIIALACTMLGAAGCFEPNLPVVAFRCGDGGLCPSGYECSDQDHCCHLVGSSPDEHGACLVPVDAAVDASPTQQDAALDAETTADASP